MALIYLNEENFENEVLNFKGKVLIDFFATWCGPCKMLSPVIEELADELDDIKVCKLDIDKATKIALQYNVMSVPTLLLFEDGVVVNTLIGFRPKEEILNELGR